MSQRSVAHKELREQEIIGEKRSRLYQFKRIYRLIYVADLINSLVRIFSARYRIFIAPFMYSTVSQPY